MTRDWEKTIRRCEMLLCGACMYEIFGEDLERGSGLAEVYCEGIDGGGLSITAKVIFITSLQMAGASRKRRTTQEDSRCEGRNDTRPQGITVGRLITGAAVHWK